MAQMVVGDDIESLRIELAEIGRSLRSSFQRRNNSSFRSISSANDDGDVAEAERLALQWTVIEKLPTFNRLRSSLFDLKNSNGDDDEDEAKKVVDVTTLGAQERHLFIEKLIKHIESDNLRLLRKIRTRIDKVGVKLPTVEVRYKNLRVEAECEVVHGKPLPTLWNSFKSIMLSGFAKVPGLRSGKAKINIFNDVSGVIKPGRLTLLLGPPGCGKTSLLKALSGNLDSSLKLTGEVSYNGYKLDEFVPQKTAAYISQFDQHIPDMTVRETLDYSARFQGVGSRAEIMMEVSRREKQAGIVPDPDIDTYMKAIAVEGLKRTLQTDYILKILGLDICADTWVGDAMRRGISGGQKKRLTTGEMTVGPTKALFMDEITNGLDSSTAFQIVACVQQLVHITESTVLVSLLQPAPEAFELFDDLILISEGKVVYHGPRDHVLEFFEDCGFKCPERKGVADFVISKKDQEQYWHSTEKAFHYVSVDDFSNMFKASHFGKQLNEELSQPYDKAQGHENALSFSLYSLSKWELFRACASREYLLMKRNSFIYIFKTVQLILVAFITMTVFLRTRMEVDVLYANYYMGSLFFALTILLVNGIPEMAMTILRLEIFYKQKELRFYPAWAYAIPASLLKIPLSLLESFVWTCLTYYVIGYSPEVERFFKQLLMLFAVHLASLSMFRFLASFFQTMVATMTAGSFTILFVLLFAGFVITQPAMPGWLKWGFWVSPLTYGEIGLSVNEFLSPRWQKMYLSTNTTLGEEALKSRGLNFDGYLYWISLGALVGFFILFNVGFILSLSFLKSPGSSSGAIISQEKLSQLQRSKSSNNGTHEKRDSKVQTPKTNIHTDKCRMVLPFTPLTVAFQDVQYYVDTPLEMREHGFTEKKLQLLADITGSFRPGVLTALMGVSGAGKTTLLDVLAGRKTTGYIEGDVRIGGYPKVQETFARISGYCEQTDIHSPQITVEESVIFSAWLRLDSKIDAKTKADFVNEVLETIELDGIKDALVGIPGISGLSNEQRKRLTIAVELVSNPSVIFMDEPTTGLDARSAAIVMRAVKNVADTGRTIVCTIHQPSIDIFESFDELLLLKTGGRVIYCGPVGKHSERVIEYFEGIPKVANIKNNYNPATWMLEVTSTSAEAELGVDFAQIYRESSIYESNKNLVNQLSTPQTGSSDLHFPTRFSQNAWGQFKFCLWKLNLSYWRSPDYNLMRLMHTFISAVFFGALFWDQGKEITNQQSLFNVFGSMYTSVIFLGINNCTTVLQHVATERTVMYREQFTGMYSSWAYSLAQVVVEIPYLFTEAVIFLIITYPMIGYYVTAYKIFWYFYGIFCSLMYFNYLGMMLVSLTPNFNIAAILASVFYMLFNLFAGFLIPKKHIPKWWIWLYYLIPTSWSLNGMLTSQYGDIEKEIEIYGEVKAVSAFIKDYFGFHHDQLPLVAVVLIAFPLPKMASMIGTEDNESESLRIELAEVGIRSLGSSANENDDDDDETERMALKFERLRSKEDDNGDQKDDNGDKETVHHYGGDVAKLGAQERHCFIEKIIKHVENDNLQLLTRIRNRIDKVGVKLPTVEVRYKNLSIDAECEVVHGKPLPTLWNSFKSMIFGFTKIPGLGSAKAKISLFNDVSGIIKPGRLTLLLGPPGSGKTTLLKALSANLDSSLKLTGEISYNGYKVEEFVPEKTAAYVSQFDQLIPEMTVRETLDFSARCQGVGSRAEIMKEVSRREKEAGIVPDTDIDTFMKGISVKGLKRTLLTDYILKILGLDICADTWIGDAMRRGISGGQKKRLTTGEMIVGPTKALFMDEITNGLDSSTAFQIVACIHQLAHITDCTVLISLLQPAPETFELFDGLILISEGNVVYHGPRDHVLEFFEGCGFRCPERKGVADFVQEVISKKDQEQYWYSAEKAFRYVSVEEFSKKFKASRFGKKLDEDLTQSYNKSQGHENALSFSVYSISKWELLRACASRELLLMKRNSFVYIFKTSQLIIIAFMTMTMFLRTRMEVDVVHANFYMGALYYALSILFLNGIPEMSMTIQRLNIFYKQKELRFYPAWAYAIPAALLKIPLSLLESVVWTCLTYYVIGYSPEIQRFLRQFFLYFVLHLASLSMFRFLASFFQTMVATTTAGSFTILFVLLFAGFIIPQPSMPVWLKWGFWVSPLTYGEIGLSVNEFLSPRWQKMLTTNTTIGQETLMSRGLNFDGYLYWISVGALFGFAILFNVGFILALSFFKSPKSSSGAIISQEKLSQLQRTGVHQKEDSNVWTPKTDECKMVLPFTPLTMVFQDVQYYVDTPLEMKERGFSEKKLQLLADITGSFRPGVLTALMGVSGAGKTTLLDVLAGRKTIGYIEGDIRIGGYPKVQETFARISGYCEQTDIHSPQITVEESVIFSAWLRLDSKIDAKTKADFVNEVLETIELDGIKDALVGIPGVSGLSNEQRKRLTIAVELVSNPSIIFMDEPTTGLDARSAAIVMRAVKNVADTGRTIVCTIHQPSIDIFESFDELILLKIGGRIIYSGPLGKNSTRVIEYLEGISGVANIRNNCNPATWMLEVTSSSSEAGLEVDFAKIYKDSSNNKNLAKQLSTPPPGSRNLHFPTRFSQNAWGQFESCLWKLNLSYWRSPSYNFMRLMHTLVTSFVFGALFWNQGKKITNQQNLFNIFGSMYTSVGFLGINNCMTVLQHVATERTVMYREKFAGMYSSWTYSLAQVAVEIPYTFTEAHIPKWWIWLYYLIPTSWSLNGLLTSQYGDISKEIEIYGEVKTVATFIEDYFGFHYDQLPLVAAVLIAFPLVYSSLFTYCIGRLNYQRR
ncbi:hypothetical protein F8388_009826 [Cannabis sativa]|uniref:ABC transporter domain-containing protein n=1 Tax=Cannabis sativa TaxID=3483 RepID=A0A7J6H3A5_CANSA|nr:hypothetical protein F8388_009826 [Cannabis sativa]